MKNGNNIKQELSQEDQRKFINTFNHRYMNDIADGIVRLRLKGIEDSYLSFLASHGEHAEQFTDAVIKFHQHRILSPALTLALIQSFYIATSPPGNTFVDAIIQLKKNHLYEDFSAEIFKKVQFANQIIEGLLELNKNNLLAKHAGDVLNGGIYAYTIAYAICRLKKEGIENDNYAQCITTNGKHAIKISNILVTAKQLNIIDLIEPNLLAQQESNMVYLDKIFHQLNNEKIKVGKYVNRLLTSNQLEEISTGLFEMRDSFILTEKNADRFMDYIASSASELKKFNQTRGRISQHDFDVLIDKLKVVSAAHSPVKTPLPRSPVSLLFELKLDSENEIDSFDSTPAVYTP